jgi:hypothetical protein
MFDGTAIPHPRPEVVSGIAPQKRSGFAVTRWPPLSGPCSHSLDGMRDACYADPTKALDHRAQASDLSDHVLYILIPTAWLIVVTFLVALFRASARGDAVVVLGRPGQPTPLERRHRWTYTQHASDPLRPTSTLAGRVQDPSGLPAAEKRASAPVPLGALNGCEDAIPSVSSHRISA